MKMQFFQFLLFVSAPLIIQSLPTTTSTAFEELIPNQYIIIFKQESLQHQIDEHFKWLYSTLVPLAPQGSTLLTMQEDPRTSQLLESGNLDFVDVWGLLHKYDVGPSFKGYSARLPAFIVKILERHSLVDFIEQDKVFTINYQEQEDHPVGKQTRVQAWGLTRISSRDHPSASDKSYTYPISAGTGVTAYIIDTGVFVAHPEFQGRARIGKSFSGDGTRDGNGHGTHVAGTIGSKTYGVAKNVSLVAVKVLDNQGSGTTANVIAGIDWAAKDSAKNNRNGKKKSVANMSLGGGASAALDKAVKAATQAGLVFAVAAGNSGRDACQLSPARVPEAITVAASDKTDALASFSERGKCVDVIAPGVDILSTWNNGKTNVISGTSMATPHVCGVVALALGEGEFQSVKEVHDYIKAVASKDKIKGSLKGAPNSLLYNMVFEGGFPDDEPKEPKLPTPEDPDEPDDPKEGECPIPQCLFDPACTSCCIPDGQNNCQFFSIRAATTPSH